MLSTTRLATKTVVARHGWWVIGSRREQEGIPFLRPGIQSDLIWSIRLGLIAHIGPGYDPISRRQESWWSARSERKSLLIVSEWINPRDHRQVCFCIVCYGRKRRHNSWRKSGRPKRLEEESLKWLITNFLDAVRVLYCFSFEWERKMFTTMGVHWLQVAGLEGPTDQRSILD